jgi:hypothetical protein
MKIAVIITYKGTMEVDEDDYVETCETERDILAKVQESLEDDPSLFIELDTTEQHVSCYII